MLRYYKIQEGLDLFSSFQSRFWLRVINVLENRVHWRVALGSLLCRVWMNMYLESMISRLLTIPNQTKSFGVFNIGKSDHTAILVSNLDDRWNALHRLNQIVRFSWVADVRHLIKREHRFGAKVKRSVAHKLLVNAFNRGFLRQIADYYSCPVPISQTSSVKGHSKDQVLLFLILGALLQTSNVIQNFGDYFDILKL